MLGTLYLFLTPSNTDGRIPSQQGTTYNLADVCPDITGQFGRGHRAKFRPSLGGGGRYVGEWV